MRRRIEALSRGKYDAARGRQRAKYSLRLATKTNAEVAGAFANLSVEAL
jgi:hypothetical protein